MNEQSSIRQLAFLILVVLSGSSCHKANTESSNASKPVYEIGAAVCLTGRGATYGKRALNGAEMAIEQINSSPDKQFGVRLAIEDTQSQARTALSAFEKLVSVKKSPVCIGFLLSDEALACAPRANETQTVLFSVGAGASELTTAGDYVFRNREVNALQGYRMAEYAVKSLRATEVAIIHANAANAYSYAAAFEERFRSLGGSILEKVIYTENKTDYRTDVQKLRAAGAKTVFITGLDTEMAIIMKQSAELAYAPQFLSTVGAESPKLLEVAGAAAEGLLYAAPPFQTDSENASVKEFCTKYAEKFGSEPDSFSANAYDAIMILAKLIQERGYTADALKQGLYQTKNYPGIGGLTSFDANGDVDKPIVIKRIRNGKFERIQ